MSAGRRGLLLSLGFVVASLALCAGPRARAQPTPRFQIQGPPAGPGTGQHRIWNQSLTPDQVREALMRFGKGDAGADELILRLLRQAIRQKNPDATPDQVDALARKLLASKEFRDAVTDAIQKHRNQNPNGNAGGNNGPPPKLTPEQLERLAKIKPEGDQGGDPFKVPEGVEGGPEGFPPFNPKNPNFDPKRFPRIDPKDPPKFDEKTGFPIDPDTGRPFDPRNGRPIDPQNPPKIEPPRPMGVGPPQVPMKPPFDPMRPIGPDNMPPNPMPEPPDDGHNFDPQNPLGTPPESPEKAAKTKAVETATAIWEKNVGPIEESPGVKRALIDLVSDPDLMEAISDGKGNTIFDALDKDTGDGEKFGDWFGGDSKWEWPKFDLGWGRGDNDFDFGGRTRTRDLDSDWGRGPSRSGGSSAFDGMGSFHLGGMQVPWALMLIILLAAVAAVVWWQWGAIFKPRESSAALAGGGGWPIDPRQINSREDVVKAFEYLSVLLCGPGAKTWTHSTIADELTSLAASEPGTALKLARLYELARYAPLDEPLTRAELLEARRLACDLAGLDEA